MSASKCMIPLTNAQSVVPTGRSRASFQHRLFIVLAPLCVVIVPHWGYCGVAGQGAEAKRYNREIEQVIRRLEAASPKDWEPVGVRFELVTQLHDTRGDRIVNTFEIRRRGQLFAHHDRFDARILTSSGAPERQYLRDGSLFLEYLPYEDELRRLWPETLEKDGKADESVFAHVFLPLLINLYPDDYLRWADAYQYRRRVKVEGKNYDVLAAIPDSAVRKSRAEAGGGDDLRPEIRYYINPRTNRVEFIERRIYRRSLRNPSGPAYLYRTCVSRVTEWRKVARRKVPSRIVGEEINPREGAPYKRFEITLGEATIGSTPATAFCPLWPRGMLFTEAGPRDVSSLHECFLAGGGAGPVTPSEEFAALRASLIAGDMSIAEPLYSQLHERVTRSLDVNDLRAFAAACRGSTQRAYVDSAGALLQTALAEATAHCADLTGQSAVDAECRVAQLHVAISEHLSRRLPVRAWDSTDGGETEYRTDYAGAAAYLEDCLPRLTSPQARRIVLGRAVTDYARADFHHQAQQLLSEYGPLCVIDGAVPGDSFINGLAERVEYWRTRSVWWQAIIDKMRQHERISNMRGGGP